MFGCGKYKLVEFSEHAVNTSFICAEGTLNQLPLSKHQNQQCAVVSVISLYSDRVRTQTCREHTCDCTYVSTGKQKHMHMSTMDRLIEYV